MATITLGCSEAADRNSPGVDKLRRLLEHECEGQVRHGVCASLAGAHRQGLCVCLTQETGLQGLCADCRKLGHSGQGHRCA